MAWPSRAPGGSGCAPRQGARGGRWQAWLCQGRLTVTESDRPGPGRPRLRQPGPDCGELSGSAVFGLFSRLGGLELARIKKDPQDWARSAPHPFPIQTHGCLLSPREERDLSQVPSVTPDGHRAPTRAAGPSLPGVVATATAVYHRELSHASRDPQSPDSSAALPLTPTAAGAPGAAWETCRPPQPPVGLQRVWPARPHSRTPLGGQFPEWGDSSKFAGEASRAS